MRVEKSCQVQTQNMEPAAVAEDALQATAGEARRAAAQAEASRIRFVQPPRRVCARPRSQLRRRMRRRPTM